MSAGSTIKCQPYNLMTLGIIIEQIITLESFVQQTICMSFVKYAMCEIDWGDRDNWMDLVYISIPISYLVLKRNNSMHCGIHHNGLHFTDFQKAYS